MKKIVATIALSLLTLTGYSQEDYAPEVPEIPVDMQFNKALYSENQGNVYMSMEPVAFILATVLPVPYDAAKAEVFGGTPDPQLHDLKSGEKTEAGKTYAYQTANVKSEDGKDLAMEMYIIKIDATTSMMVSGAYDINAKATFEQETKKAALSAKVAK